MAEFAALAPFGPSNPKPRFHTGPVAVVDGPRILKERHLKMSVKQDGRVLRAIQWNAAEREHQTDRAEGRRRDRLHRRRERVPRREVRRTQIGRFPIATTGVSDRHVCDDRRHLCHLRPWSVGTICVVSSWQKRAQFALAVVAIGVIGVVGYTLRPREVRVAPPPLERLDPKATIETRGGDVIQLKGSRQDARVEFERQVTYDTGETRLMGVKVTVDNRAGRSYTITGKEARVGKDQASYDITGDVKLETSDGLTAFSEQATYTDAEKIVRAPGPGPLQARPHCRAPASASPSTSSATRCGCWTRRS